MIFDVKRCNELCLHICTRLFPATTLLWDAKRVWVEQLLLSKTYQNTTQHTTSMQWNLARQDLAPSKQSFIYLVLQVSFRPGVYRKRCTCPWAQIIRLGANIYTFSAEVAGVFHHVVLSVKNWNLKENKNLCETKILFFLSFFKINSELYSLAKKAFCHWWETLSSAQPLLMLRALCAVCASSSAHTNPDVTRRRPQSVHSTPSFCSVLIWLRYVFCEPGSNGDSLTKCKQTKGSADPVGSSSAQPRTRLSRCGESQRKS